MSDHLRRKPPLLKRLLQRLRGESPSSAAMRESLEEVIEESERKSPALVGAGAGDARQSAGVRRAEGAAM